MDGAEWNELNATVQETNRFNQHTAQEAYTCINL